jgi:hypothetical protein
LLAQEAGAHRLQEEELNGKKERRNLKRMLRRMDGLGWVGRLLGDVSVAVLRVYGVMLSSFFSSVSPPCSLLLCMLMLAHAIFDSLPHFVAEKAKLAMRCGRGGEFW